MPGAFYMRSTIRNRTRSRWTRLKKMKIRVEAESLKTPPPRGRFFLGTIFGGDRVSWQCQDVKRTKVLAWKDSLNPTRRIPFLLAVSYVHVQLEGKMAPFSVKRRAKALLLLARL